MTKPSTNLDRLKYLRDHLFGVDTGSGDARLIAWAINEIERFTQFAKDQRIRHD